MGEEEGKTLSDREEEEEGNEEEEEGKAIDEGELENRGLHRKKQHKKKRLRLEKEASAADRRGVCYLSRIPPHMNPLKLRQILSQYGEVQRIYLAPENPSAQVRRKRAGGFRGQEFSEGWVEFTKKSVAKWVANMLNGEQIGGKKRSSFYYDLWNIKYLSKFKWDNLTEEIAYKNAIREQKLALEISAAKKERDFYLSKVDKSHALSSIRERLKKKQKVQEGSESNANTVVDILEPKVIRQFKQTRPVVDTATKSKPKLSKDFLAGIFGGSSS
ncbi:pre-rRNA-processing protein ESF2 [Magnolia sinica]|uniref:pre-rRNA-processing protein ESF2 n=1 Tax=Magnolia sinica TaxID=86752 RepID=UPI0026580EC3|nr:pre-rRNA-processing protein ESF2 [Magnolia sinica]